MTEPIHVMDMEVSIVINNIEGVCVTNLSTFYAKQFKMIPTKGDFICEIDKLSLRSGKYIVDLYCSINNEVADRIEHAATFNVTDGDYFGTGRVTLAQTGVVFLDHTWGIE